MWPLAGDIGGRLARNDHIIAHNKSPLVIPSILTASAGMQDPALGCIEGGCLGGGGGGIGHGVCP